MEVVKMMKEMEVVKKPACAECIRHKVGVEQYCVNAHTSLSGS